ncbi:MAG: multiheme c-type cytochrome [candidate division Zixibacteria bacterium]
MKKIRIILSMFIALLLLILTDGISAKECIECHQQSNPSLIKHWQESKHALADIGCIDCHQAEKGEVDAFEHNGAIIATIVSPLDCGKCHEAETRENSESRHAHGAEFIGSLDNFLGEIVEGTPATILGCRQCHGSEVRVMENGKLDPATWPNTGIGRINPDGSRGSCSACHLRHSFSSAQARRPENCGRCHMGPDHPQIEIYNESKHGIKFYASEKEMNLESDSWVLGKDYSAAPTCATCHMSATIDQPISHEVGGRISWTLRPIVSTRLENWEGKRNKMTEVCNNCHGLQWVNNFFIQFDNAVEHYNVKFAIPAKNMMDDLKSEGKITKTPFDDKIEWTFFELWHHEGRRARHGAAMMGPDYTQWHGFYEVAKHFYFKFIPEAEGLLPGVSEKYLDNELHAWRKGLSEEQIKRQLEFYKSRYGQ